MMNTTRTALLDLIAKTPMMRAMQIADRLNIDVDQVDALLRQSLQSGHIIEHEVDAPNHRKAMAYELSAQYSAASARALAPTTIERTANPVAAVVNGGATGRQQTKVDRAIAYVRSNGPSSSAQLHAELGLAAGVHVSSYLGSAIRSGKMLRDGNIWSLPSTGTVTPAQIPKFSAIRSQSCFVESPRQAQPTAAATAEQPCTSLPAVFRCALWSDGSFEIQRNGTTIACLHPSEHSTVVETLQRARTA